MSKLTATTVLGLTISGALTAAMTGCGSNDTAVPDTMATAAVSSELQGLATIRRAPVTA